MRSTEFEDSKAAAGSTPEQAKGPKCATCYYELVEEKGDICWYCGHVYPKILAKQRERKAKRAV